VLATLTKTLEGTFSSKLETRSTDGHILVEATDTSGRRACASMTAGWRRSIAPHEDSGVVDAICDDNVNLLASNFGDSFG
jgi:hypothetical protein